MVLDCFASLAMTPGVWERHTVIASEAEGAEKQSSRAATLRIPYFDALSFAASSADDTAAFVFAMISGPAPIV